MNEKKLAVKISVIEQMINGIDEKYTSAAADRLCGKADDIREMTEIIVEHPEPRKRSRLRKFLSAAVPTAAIIALVIGGIKLFTMLPEISKYPDTDNPDVTSGSEPADVDTAPAPDDNNVPRELVFFSNYYIELDREGSESGMTLKLYEFDENGDVEEPKLAFSTGIQNEEFENKKCRIYGQSLQSGDLLALSVPYPKAENGDIRVYYSIYLFHTSIDSIQRITDVYDDVWDYFDEEHFTAIKGSDNFRIHDADGKVKTFLVSFGENAIYRMAINSDMDESETVVSFSELLKGEPTDLTLFENTFYGKWAEYGNPAEGLNLTYYGYNKYEVAKNYVGEIAETNDGWFMAGINGGMPVMLYIPYNNRNMLMEYNSYVTYNDELNDYTVQLSKYDKMYERMTTGDISEETGDKLQAGMLTLAGIRKLDELTGGCGWPPDYVTDANGKEWEFLSFNINAAGTVVLVSYSDDEVVLNAKYAPKDLIDYEKFDSNNARIMRIVMQRNGDEWIVDKAHEFEPLETSVGRDVLSVKYLAADNGCYYAVRKINDGGRTKTEYLYHDEYEYYLLCVFDGGDVPDPVVTDGIMFFVADNTKGNAGLCAANGRQLCLGSDDLGPNIGEMRIDVQKIGELYYVRAIGGFDENGNVDQQDEVFDISPCYGNAIECEVNNSPADNHSVIEMDFGGGDNEAGVKRYYAEPETFAEASWYLDYEYRRFRYFFLISGRKAEAAALDNNTRFHEDKFYDDALQEYVYLCEYDDFYNYLTKIFTEETAEYLLRQFYCRLCDGKVYMCTDIPQRGAEKLTCEIETETANSVELRYSVSDNSDGDVTFITEARKTDNGWRLTSHGVSLLS